MTDDIEIPWGEKQLPFEEAYVKGYIDECIRHWRGSDEPHAEYYVDAYQSVRASVFGETLSKRVGDDAE